MIDYEQRKLMFEERIANYCLMDDEFFRACMRNNPEAVELIIRIILNDDKLVVESMKTQEDMKNLFGKSSWFDVHAIDKLGRHLDVEIQNASKGAGMKRARYYSSLLDANISAPNDDYEKMPITFMIMLAENDIFKRKLPLYHIRRTVAETGDVFNDGSNIIYVNGKYRGDTPLGRLIKDFHEKDAKKIYYKQLKERVDFFKNTKEGVKQMSDEMEKFGNERETDGKLKTAINLINQGKLSIEDISNATELSLETVEELAKKINKDLI